MMQAPKLDKIAVSQDRTLFIRQQFESGDIFPEAHCGLLMTWRSVMELVKGTDDVIDVRSAITADLSDAQDMNEQCAAIWLDGQSLLADDGDIRSYDGLPTFVQAGLPYETFMDWAREEQAALRSEIADRRSLSVAA